MDYMNNEYMLYDSPRLPGIFRASSEHLLRIFGVSAGAFSEAFSEAS